MMVPCECGSQCNLDEPVPVQISGQAHGHDGQPPCGLSEGHRPVFAAGLVLGPAHAQEELGQARDDAGILMSWKKSERSK